jgi:hypothetical protein
MGNKGNINVCPNCSSKMEKRLAPFKYHGMYIGKFDAYVCNFCHRTYFTEKTYKAVMDLPLNPDDYGDFSEEAYMPPVKSFSIFILLKRRKPQTSALMKEGGVLEAITEPVGYKQIVKEVIVQEA